MSLVSKEFFYTNSCKTFSQFLTAARQNGGIIVRLEGQRPPGGPWVFQKLRSPVKVGNKYVNVSIVEGFFGIKNVPELDSSIENLLRLKQDPLNSKSDFLYFDGLMSFEIIETPGSFNRTGLYLPDSQHRVVTGLVSLVRCGVRLSNNNPLKQDLYNQLFDNQGKFILRYNNEYFNRIVLNSIIADDIDSLPAEEKYFPVEVLRKSVDKWLDRECETESDVIERISAILNGICFQETLIDPGESDRTYKALHNRRQESYLSQFENIIPDICSVLNNSTEDVRERGMNLLAGFHWSVGEVRRAYHSNIRPDILKGIGTGGSIEDGALAWASAIVDNQSTDISFRNFEKKLSTEKDFLKVFEEAIELLQFMKNSFTPGATEYEIFTPLRTLLGASVNYVYLIYFCIKVRNGDLLSTSSSLLGSLINTDFTMRSNANTANLGQIEGYRRTNILNNFKTKNSRLLIDCSKFQCTRDSRKNKYSKVLFALIDAIYDKDCEMITTFRDMRYLRAVNKYLNTESTVDHMVPISMQSGDEKLKNLANSIIACTPLRGIDNSSLGPGTNVLRSTVYKQRDQIFPMTKALLVNLNTPCTSEFIKHARNLFIPKEYSEEEINNFDIATQNGTRLACWENTLNLVLSELCPRLS